MASSLKVQRKDIYQYAAYAFPGVNFCTSSLKVQKKFKLLTLNRLLIFCSSSLKVQLFVKIDFGDSSCWHISRVLIFWLLHRKFKGDSCCTYILISHFQDVTFLLLHWKIKGDIFPAAYSFPDVKFLASSLKVQRRYNK